LGGIGNAVAVNAATDNVYKGGNQLQITLEAADIGENGTVWRDTMTVAAPDLIAIRSEITVSFSPIPSCPISVPS
jgi:hypothetical protein